MRVTWNSFVSPMGALTLVECASGPLVVEYAASSRGANWAERLRQGRPGISIEVGPCPQLERWLEAYFRGRPRPFAYPAHLADFFRADQASETVWRLLCTIPLGETRSYEDIARGSGQHPRRAGQIISANPLSICIPCHRVVGKHGDLVGYGGGLKRKRWLLDHELRTCGLVLS
jgi:O-6-methylguanine DNA methyltransferase